MPQSHKMEFEKACKRITLFVVIVWLTLIYTLVAPEIEKHENTSIGYVVVPGLGVVVIVMVYALCISCCREPEPPEVVVVHL